MNTVYIDKREIEGSDNDVLLASPSAAVAAVCPPRLAAATAGPGAAQGSADHTSIAARSASNGRTEPLWTLRNGRTEWC